MRAHATSLATTVRAEPSTSIPAHVLDDVAIHLEVAAAAREAQLDALPPAFTPAMALVAKAHRESVHRILNAIRAAQAHLAAGTYGQCSSCGRGPDVDSDVSRPWAPLCGACARR